MKIAAHLVVKDDEYYVGMAVKSIAPFVDGIYVQDQESLDGTVSEIKKAAGCTPLVIDTVFTGLPRFDPAYNEITWRNLAIARCEKIFKPNWILLIDADEIFTEYFFTSLKVLDLSNVGGVKCATDRFVTPRHKTQHARATEEHGGNKYYDPHVRLWRAGKNIKFMKNPSLDMMIHVVFSNNPVPLCWLPGTCHVHLHRTFGPKSWDWWASEDDQFERKTPFNPRIQAPKCFESAKNMGEVVECNFEWPDYVMEKWGAWGYAC